MELKTIIEFYEKTDILKAVYTVNAEGRKEGQYEEYLDNEMPLTLCTYKDGILDGPYKEYNFGQLGLECTYKDGKKEGTERSYYANGKPLQIRTYKNGESDGLYESYYDNGQLWEKTTSKNGHFDGPYISYYKNGQIEMKCTHRNGRYDGPYESYYQNGQLKEKGIYENGKKVKTETETRAETKERKRIVARLAALNHQMEPTPLRQRAKRALVEEYRKAHPKTADSG